MKAIYCLLALGLVGWASSEFAFKTGKTYHYAVRGRLMNGLTEISTQYSGLEMDYKLRLSVIGHNTVNFKPEEMKFFEVNDVLKGGWRDGELQNERPVELTQEIRQYLESPMDVTFNKGVVESITCQENLPTWAVNMKKAMASHFVLDTTGVNVAVEGNLNRKTGHETPEERNLESGFYYQTMEKTIHGECLTQYTVSQNGPFNSPYPFHQQHQPGVALHENTLNVHEKTDLIGELPWHQTYHKFCQENDQVFEIIKSVNFTSCVHKPLMSFMAPSLSNNARPGDNHFAGSMGLRTVVSRVLACGKSRDEFQILKIRQEELVKVGLHETKKIMTGGIKNITLYKITEEQSPVPVTNPKVHNNILYRFSEEKKEKIMTMEEMLETPMNDAGYMMNFGDESVEEHKITEDDHIKVHPKPSLTEAPLNSILITPLKNEGMKKRVQVLVREIVQDLLNKNRAAETLAEKETLSKISTVSKILRYFSYSDVQELYNQLANKHQSEEDKTMRQVFLDAVAIAGTNPNVKFLLDLIKKREITDYHVSSVLMTLPMYIRTPTQELLNEYFNLIKSEVLRGDKESKTTAILSFSTVLYEACVNTNVRQTRYPVALYGKFCDAQVVEQTYLPYFIQELERFIHTKTEEQPENMHWKLVYLTAVGNIGHPAVLPQLQKYMDNVQNPIVKTRVILALKHMIVSRSHQQNQELHREIHVVDRDHHDILTDKIVAEKVMPILLSAAFDKGEHTDVRMAAITLIFHSSAANKAIYQQLAYMTWFPASRQVHSFIFHSFKSMAEIQHPVNKIQNRMQTLARQVLPLAKPVTVGMQSSRSVFHGDFIPEFLTGYFTQLSYFGSRDSILPNLVHYRSFYRFGGENGLGVNPLEFTLHGNTIQKLWNHFAEKFITPSVADSERHEDLDKIHDILGIKDRKHAKQMEGYFYMKIRNEMERFITINKEKIEEWTRTIKNDFLPKLENGLPVQYQKTLRLTEYTQEFPSIFGLPMTYKHRMPLHLQVNGNIKLAKADKDWQMQLELRPVYAWTINDKLSIKAPFLNKKYVTGLKKHFVAQFPLRALVRKAPKNQIILEITPTHIHEDKPNSEIHLITVHRVPYTAIVTDECYPVFHREGGQVKVVRVVETPYHNERKYGEHRFGLALHVKEESDFEVEAEGNNKWTNYIRRFHNVRTLINLGWLGAPSTRWAKRSLSIDMAQSQTKTLAFVIGGNWPWNKDIVHHEERIENEERHYVIALLGKKNPIRPLQSVTGIQKILVKGEPSTFHYLAHFAYTRGIHAKVNMRLAAGEATKEAAAKLPLEIPSIAAIREYLIDSRVEVQHMTGCFELRSEMEVPTWANPMEIVILRKRLLEQELVLNKKTEIHFGSTCNQMPHQIKIKGQWKRGEKMTEWAKNKSPQAKKCEEDERKGFSVSPVCLWVADHQAAALNVGDMEIEYTQNMPVWFKNVTYKMEDYLKAYLYTYMEHNRFPEGQVVSEQQMKIHFKMTPNKEYLTFKIMKPSGHIEFRNIKLAPWAKKFLPFTATQSIVENVKDRTLRFYSEQSCQIEGNWVSTFDNVTYSFGDSVATGCQHLLAKDCTGKYPLAVLVSDIHTQRKTVTVLLGGKTKVVIMPTNSLMGLRKGEYKVTVNGEMVSQFPKVIRHTASNELIATINRMSNGGIQLRSHRIKVATDGVRVVVYGNGNDLKNKLCGICGNNDAEKSAEFRSPKNCPLSNGSLLIASYAFDSFNQEHRGQCKVQPEMKARIEKENADCKRHSTNIKEFKETSEEYMNVVDDDECNLRQRITKRFPGVGLCTSERPVLQCAQGCYAKDTTEKEIKFQCAERKPTTYPTYVNKMFTITLPTLCVH